MKYKLLSYNFTVTRFEITLRKEVEKESREKKMAAQAETVGITVYSSATSWDRLLEATFGWEEVKQDPDEEWIIIQLKRRFKLSLDRKEKSDFSLYIIDLTNIIDIVDRVNEFEIFVLEEEIANHLIWFYYPEELAGEPIAPSAITEHGKNQIVELYPTTNSFTVDMDFELFPSRILSYFNQQLDDEK